jgi:hypothetical protein
MQHLTLHYITKISEIKGIVGLLEIQYKKLVFVDAKLYSRLKKIAPKNKLLLDTQCLAMGRRVFCIQRNTVFIDGKRTSLNSSHSARQSV